MKKLKMFMLSIGLVIVLAACNNEETKSAEQIVDENAVSFEMANGEVAEVKDISEATKEKIIAAFNEYIVSFNEGDVERYIATLSTNPEGFNLDEERETLTSTFAAYEVERIPDHITITKYTEDEVNVYATLKTNLVEKETGTSVESKGKQVTVLTQENNEWKISSVFYIGEE